MTLCRICPILTERLIRPKKLHLELLRIIAVYLVVLTHTGKRGFMYFTTLEPSVMYFVTMLIPVVCNIAVPLFFMISGATLIGKDESPGQIWRRRIPRHLAVLVLASLMMYVYYGLKGDTHMSVMDFLRTIYTRNVIVPYWFLYGYLGFLILLPFLRRMIRGLTDREWVYLFGLFIIVNGVIPMVQYRLSEGSLFLNSSLNLTLITNNLVIFPAVGWYLESKELTRRQVGILWLVTALAIGATVYMTHYKITLTGQLGEGQVGTFYKSLCVLPAAAVYATAKRVKALPKWLEKPVITVGSCTFGIYLIEQIVRERGCKLCDLMCLYIPDILATLIYTGFVVVICFCLTWIAKHIPGLKKLI